MPAPHAVATFRFEVIAPLLDISLPPEERSQLLREQMRPTLWPDGSVRRVGRATLFRWLALYRERGLDGLLPKRRVDSGKPRGDREKIVEHAIHLLIERPRRSATLLVELVAAKFSGQRVSRATLWRDVRAHPLWPTIGRGRVRARKRRRRFQAREPHAIWQLDAKGSFHVRLSSGRVVRVTVLTVLDDASRAVLCATVSSTEHLGAAVKVFRRAALRFGLPSKVYADRHSVYDSGAFRTGLATLGVHRIGSKPGNPEARGKIEAYHRTLDAWFVEELKHQAVVDLRHLEDLLQAAIDLLYQPHRHRGLRTSPAKALAGRISERRVSAGDLARAFFEERRLKAHKKTGEVALPGGLFIAPAGFEGKRVSVRFDPEDPSRPRLIAWDREIPLRPAFETPEEKPTSDEPPRGAGALQRLLDVWRGRELPQASPGFGLPEVFEALASTLGRSVPRTESEAEAISEFYRGRGPFAPDAFENALSRARAELGEGRPLQAFLRFLDRLLPRNPPDEQETP